MIATLSPTEENESKFQSGEQLEEDGDEPAGELAEAKLLEREVEQ
jgi:hypothetical protein